MDIHTILALMALFAPSALNDPPPDRIYRVAEAISRASPDLEDPRVLIAISWGETRFGFEGVPFGATDYARNHRGDLSLTLSDYAYAAARSFERGMSRCRDGRGVWIFYATGRCSAPETIQVRVRFRRQGHMRWKWERHRHPAQIYADEMLGRMRRIENACR